MNNLFAQTKHGAWSTVALVLAFCGPLQAAPVSLNPLLLPPGMAVASGGLATTWFKADNDARFTSAQFNGQPVKNSTWGTGVWTISDVAAIASNPRPSYVTGSITGIGAINYANNIYNNTVNSGAKYGNWEADYARPLAPIVGTPNACQAELIVSAACANEVNYAAVFAGYLNVMTSGVYNFGIFADDIFDFRLTGFERAYSLTKSEVAGNPGRTFNSLNEAGFHLNEGFYGIDLAYANRLEAGVINLVWQRPEQNWETIGSNTLYHDVPEPETLGLMLMGLLGVWSTTRRAQRSSKSTAVQRG